MERSRNKNIAVLSNIVIILLIALVTLTTIVDPKTVQASSVVNGVIYSGDTNKNNISLMINVYWGTEYIEDILKVFEEYKMTTTFFVGGSWAEDNEKLLTKIKENGHEIGNHGYSHKDHDKLSYEQNYEEIFKTHKIVKDKCGIEMNLFAPPSGAYNTTTVNVAKSLNYKTIMWTRDTIDWRDKDENLVFTRAINKINGGDLILMHPTAHTLKALPRILNFIKSKDLTCSPVSTTIMGIDV